VHVRNIEYRLVILGELGGSLGGTRVEEEISLNEEGGFKGWVIGQLAKT